MTMLVLLSLFAGAMIPLGGWLASREHIRSDWLETELRHTVIALGAGALLSAVALVLIPEGTRHLAAGPALIWVTVGALALAALDIAMSRRGTPRAQMIAMVSDFIPEAVALGALLEADPAAAPLLALMIGLQNLPEGFNAYREVTPPPGRDTRLRDYCLLALLGPAAALLGYVFLAEAPQATGALMCIAAGGILYLMFQDIAPQVKLEHHFAPPLGAVAGFLLGLAGHLMLG